MLYSSTSISGLLHFLSGMGLSRRARLPVTPLSVPRLTIFRQACGFEHDPGEISTVSHKSHRSNVTTPT